MHFFLASFVSGRVRSRVGWEGRFRGGKGNLGGYPPPWDGVVLLGKNYQDQFFFFGGDRWGRFSKLSHLKIVLHDACSPFFHPRIPTLALVSGETLGFHLLNLSHQPFPKVEDDNICKSR